MLFPSKNNKKIDILFGLCAVTLSLSMMVSGKIRTGKTELFELLDFDWTEKKNIKDKNKYADYSVGTWLLFKKTTSDYSNKDKIREKVFRIEFQPDEVFLGKFSTIDNSKYALLSGASRVLAFDPQISEKPFIDRSWGLRRFETNVEYDYETIYEFRGSYEEGDLGTEFTSFEDRNVNSAKIIDVVKMLNYFPYYQFEKPSDFMISMYDVNVKGLVNIPNLMNNYINGNVVYYIFVLTDQEKNFLLEGIMAQMIKMMYTGELSVFHLSRQYTRSGDVDFDQHFINRSLDDSARNLAKELLKDEAKSAGIVELFKNITTDLNSFGNDKMEFYFGDRPMNHQVLNEFFRDYEDNMDLATLKQKRVQKRRPFTAFPDNSVTKLNELFYFYEEIDEETGEISLEEKEKIEIFQTSLTEILKILQSIFRKEPDLLNLEENKDALDDVLLESKEHWERKDVFKNTPINKNFKPETDYVEVFGKLNFTAILIEYIKYYMIDYSLNKWEGAVIDHILTSELFTSLEITNPQEDPADLKLVRSLLYSAGLVDFNMDLDLGSIFHDNFSIFKPKVRLII